MTNGRGNPFRDEGKQGLAGRAASAGGVNVGVLLERAGAALDAGRVVEAEALFRQVVEAISNQPEALQHLVVMAYQAGQSGLALALIDRAIAARPEVAESHVCRGDVLCMLHRYEEAVDAYAQANRLRPENAEAFVSRGNALCALGRYEDAVKSFEAAIEVRPAYAEAHNNRGSALHSLGRFEAALESFEKAAALRPDYTQARRNANNTLHDLTQQRASLRPPDKTESSGRDLVFYCGPTDEVWNPETAKTTGIGGSEEAVLWLSRLLHARGWRVTVYTNCGEEREYDGVVWKPYWTWNHRDRQDVTVIWRYPQLLTYEFNSGKVILDLHDAFDESDFTVERLKKVDRIFVKSKFHRWLYPHVLDAKFAIAPNGIDAAAFVESGERDPMLLINTSSADRSLEAFLDCFAEIKKQVPEARAQWAYGWGVFDGNFLQPAQRAEWKAKMQARTRELGVEELGRVSHDEVAELYRKANVFGYPSEYAEIDCISLSKAMAAGAIPITTDFAAMGDKAGHGGVFLQSKKTREDWLGGRFHWEMTDSELKAQFVREAVRLLKNPPTEAEREPMRAWARTAFDWNAIADAWHKVLSRQANPRTVGELLEEGRGHHRAGQLGEAERLYREMLQVAPNDADALLLLGIIALQTGQAAKAVELIDRSIRNRPGYAEGYFIRGNAQYALGRYADAAKSYGQAIGLHPEYADAYNNRAAALYELGDRGGALESCDRAIALRADYVDAYSNRGNCMYALGRYEEALESFDKAIALRPNDANAHCNRGNVEQVRMHYLKAMESYDRAIALSPNHAEAHNNRGSALYALEQYEAALESYDKAIALKPDYADAHVNRQNAAWGLKWLRLRADYDYEQERRIFEEARKEVARIWKFENKAEMKAALDALPLELRSHPAVCNLRNLNFLKTESSGRDVVFYCDRTSEVWNPETARTKGIGGSEEAVIWLSRLLHERGWKVTVHANCGDGEKVYDGVVWRPRWMWNCLDRQDVTVLWRFPQITRGEINSAAVVVDLHDVVFESEFTEERLKKIDRIFVKSKFHRSLFPGLPDEKFVIMPNGIDAKVFEKDGERDPMLLINTSSAERSLGAFVDCFAEIKKEVPGARAQWAYGWGVWDFSNAAHPERMEWKVRIEERMREVGVENLGRLNHGEIAALYRKANVFAYPSEMAEIDCISLSKAMAAGAVPVTTDFSALGEKAGHGGVFIHSRKTKDDWILGDQFHFEITDPEQKAEFVRAAVRLLKDPVAEKDREAMREWARTTFDWNVVAARWDEALGALLRVRAGNEERNA